MLLLLYRTAYWCVLLAVPPRGLRQSEQPIKHPSSEPSAARLKCVLYVIRLVSACWQRTLPHLAPHSSGMVGGNHIGRWLASGVASSCKGSRVLRLERVVGLAQQSHCEAVQLLSAYVCRGACKGKAASVASWQGGGVTPWAVAGEQPELQPSSTHIPEASGMLPLAAGWAASPSTCRPCLHCKASRQVWPSGQARLTEPHTGAFDPHHDTRTERGRKAQLTPAPDALPRDMHKTRLAISEAGRKDGCKRCIAFAVG